MTPERWQQIRDLLDSVIPLAPAERSAFLDEHCSSDPALRQEVEQLLDTEGNVPPSFLESPVLEQLPEHQETCMSSTVLPTGTKLGPYVVQGLIGAGGMGEVYRARDTRLDRTVAVKVISRSLSGDPMRRQRFEQEARTISALQHPNICTLHDVGSCDGIEYLVMEYLEGQTLRQEIRRGPMAVRKALGYALQIAQGLAAAHESGIVHRDLKPENLFITKDGRVKILDFGLAKLSQRKTTSEAEARTFSNATEPGTIVGTVGYMSPEQVQSQAADHRSDIFTLGAILYEMLTGTKAFLKQTTAETMAAIVNEDPPSLKSSQRVVLADLEWVILACLAKEPKSRWQNTHDLQLELERISDHELNPASKLREEQGQPSIHAYLLPPDKSEVLFSGPNAGPVVVSPDGRRIAFTARHGDGTLLCVQRIDSPDVVPLSGTEGASFPFWSHDSHSLGFFAGGKLKSIDAGGGPAQSLCDAPTGRGGSWNQDGTIIFAPTPTDPLYCVSAGGGPRRALTALDPARCTSHRWPNFLPDGRHFLYLGGHPLRSGGIYVGSLDGGEHKLILHSYWNAIFAPPGFLLFVRDAGLFARAFDAQRFETHSDDIRIADQVMADAWVHRAVFSASETGILVYQRGEVAKGPRLAWFQRTGKIAKAFPDESSYALHRLSPDGMKLAVVDRFGAVANIWILDLVRDTKTRLTFDSSTNVRPVWSPDGTRIAFSCNRRGHFRLYQKAASGVGDEKLLYESETEEQVESWSPDGKYLACLQRDPERQNAANIWILPLVVRQKPFPFIEDEFDKAYPQFSPDGKLMAYASNESGGFEIYVSHFPSAKGTWQVSACGGTFPRWRGDGKELFYLGSDNRLRATEIAAQGSGLEIGSTRILFEVKAVSPPASPFDVTADGKRFLINTMPAFRGSSEPVTMLINWIERVKR